MSRAKITSLPQPSQPIRDGRRSAIPDDPFDTTVSILPAILPIFLIPITIFTWEQCILGYCLLGIRVTGKWITREDWLSLSTPLCCDGDNFVSDFPCFLDFCQLKIKDYLESVINGRVLYTYRGCLNPSSKWRSPHTTKSVPLSDSTHFSVAV